MSLWMQAIVYKIWLGFNCKRKESLYFTDGVSELITPALN